MIGGRWSYRLVYFCFQFTLSLHFGSEECRGEGSDSVQPRYHEIYSHDHQILRISKADKENRAFHIHQCLLGGASTTLPRNLRTTQIQGREEQNTKGVHRQESL